MSTITIITEPLPRAELQPYLLNDEMVKAVVDLEKGIMAVGGELHADEERVLLEAGSHQSSLWGINLYIHDTSDGWIEFNSMINIRPRDGNRSRGVESPVTQKAILNVVSRLVA